jgi:glycosyltransferase involved in cell wall biosynthesis
VEAAGLLRDDGVRLTLVGEGQDLPAARARARALGIGPPRLEFVEGFLPRPDLDRRIAAADACLGIFGTTEKAARVVPCKVHDALAAGKALVTADTPAARSLLRDGESALLVPAGDPGALAAALRRLRGDPGLRARLGAGAARVWGERLRPDRVVEGLVEELRRRCPGRPRTA